MSRRKLNLSRCRPYVTMWWAIFPPWGEQSGDTPSLHVHGRGTVSEPSSLPTNRSGIPGIVTQVGISLDVKRPYCKSPGESCPSER